MIYKLADFIVEFKNPSPDVVDFFKDYISEGTPQASFEISEQEIEFETQKAQNKYTRLNSELTAMLRKFSRWTLDYNAFLLHSALVDVDGVGVAFAARSGTGKTTHIRLWQQLLGERMTIINGDKPIIRFFENEQYPIGYGTPWNGKERFGINGKTAVKHFCFIERSDINSCEKIEASQILNQFFGQIYLPKNEPIVISKMLNFANKFLKNITVWRIKCNMDISAAETAYNTIFKENTNEA